MPRSTGAFQDSWLADLDGRVAEIVGAMQHQIERMMAAKARVTKVPGLRSGRLNPSGLYRLALHDGRVFRRKQVSKAKSTAACLLVDNSGSMLGDKMTLAMTSAYALSQTLERVGVPHECIGFTTASRMPRRATAAGRPGPCEPGFPYSRVLPIILKVYKGYDERLSLAVRRRFAVAAAQQPAAFENVDGESLEHAARRILRRPEGRKVILTLSDGYPCGGIPEDLDAHLHATVKAVCAARIELVGIGIMSDAVKVYYPQHLVLERVEDLPIAVMGELRRILTN